MRKPETPTVVATNLRRPGRRKRYNRDRAVGDTPPTAGRTQAGAMSPPAGARSPDLAPWRDRRSPRPCTDLPPAEEETCGRDRGVVRRPRPSECGPREDGAGRTPVGARSPGLGPWSPHAGPGSPD